MHQPEKTRGGISCIEVEPLSCLRNSGANKCLHWDASFRRSYFCSLKNAQKEVIMCAVLRVHRCYRRELTTAPKMHFCKKHPITGQKNPEKKRTKIKHSTFLDFVHKCNNKLFWSSDSHLWPTFPSLQQWLRLMGIVVLRTIKPSGCCSLSRVCLYIKMSFLETEETYSTKVMFKILKKVELFCMKPLIIIIIIILILCDCFIQT